MLLPRFPIDSLHIIGWHYFPILRIPELRKVQVALGISTLGEKYPSYGCKAAVLVALVTCRTEIIS